MIGCSILRIYIDAKNRIYVAARNSAVNCFRSDDVGMSWEQLGNNPSCLLFREDNTYAGTDPQGPADEHKNGDIVVSVDDGATWSVVYKEWAYFGFSDLLMNRKGILFAQCYEYDEDRTPLRIIRSLDGGISWHTIQGGSIEGTILLDAADNIIIKNVGTYERNTLVKSTDNGDTWAKLPVRGSDYLHGRNAAGFLLGEEHGGNIPLFLFIRSWRPLEQILRKFLSI